MYALIRPLLFRLDPETSHRLTFLLLRFLYRLPGFAVLLRKLNAGRTPRLPVTVFGIEFANPVGLAAGLDKNAELIPALAAMGFGWVEAGTVTPRPQSGNPRPRLFRLEDDRAIINRMGFNNAGLTAFLHNLRGHERSCPVGINLGKNKDTPEANAVDDYLIGLRAAYAYADYITINISSPNTPGLRSLQEEAPLAALLGAIKQEQTALAGLHGRYVPIALKIAPDLADEAIDTIARLLLAHKMDAVIATNTTVERPGLAHEPRARETGGLSGAPLRSRATEVIHRLYVMLQGRIPIIGVGGIGTAAEAWEKLVAGADLLQLYSAFIYRGPAVVREIVQGLAAKTIALGATSLAEAVALARTQQKR
ncbi:MAG: quinone-dependent dihydroorotate dehydrogenase [Gammaproteobacteria bacterium]|nr:quinone-dependent dihydroorotate dehydrogenase [Gammaproteobacteria bacterium]